jgi:hypothetical protein
MVIEAQDFICSKFCKLVIANICAKLLGISPKPKAFVR